MVAGKRTFSSFVSKVKAKISEMDHNRFVYALLIPCMSSDDMFAKVQSAKPTAYMFEWFMSLKYRQLVPQWSRIYALLEGICDKCEDLLALIQQQHDTQVTQPFVAEAGTCYEFETFHLSEVGLGAKHVDVKELGDIVVSCVRVLFTEGGANGCRLLLDQGTFVCDSLLG